MFQLFQRQCLLNCPCIDIWPNPFFTAGLAFFAQSSHPGFKNKKVAFYSRFGCYRANIHMIGLSFYNCVHLSQKSLNKYYSKQFEGHHYYLFHFLRSRGSRHTNWHDACDHGLNPVYPLHTRNSTVHRCVI